MEYNFQKLSKRQHGGFPAKKTSERKKHYGPFMCELNSKGNRCVQSRLRNSIKVLLNVLQDYLRHVPGLVRQY